MAIFNHTNINMNDAAIWLPRKHAAIVNPDSAYDDHIVQYDGAPDHTLTGSGIGALEIGYVSDPENFSRNDLSEGSMRIEGLKIKSPGTDEYKIPDRLARFGGFIRAVAEDQHARSSLATSKYALLYIRRTYVRFDGVQVLSEWHRDTVSSFWDNNPHRREEFKKAANDMSLHIYSTSDLACTQVQTSPVRNAADIFSDKAQDEFTRRQQQQHTRQLNPHEIVLMTSDVYHRPRPLTREWAAAAKSGYPQIAHLLDEQGGMRNFATIVYMSSEEAREQLMRQPKVYPSSLDWS